MALRPTAVATLVAAVALSAAACGSSSGSASNTSPSSGAAGSASTTPVSAAAAKLVPAAIRSSGVLTVGTSAPSPPYEYFESQGKTLTGVEIDLVTALAQGLGLKVKWSNTAWDGLIPALSSGRYDAIASQVADYTDREKTVTFVDYFKSGAEVVVPVADKSQYSSLTDLCGKTLAAGAGSDNLQIAQNLSKSCVSQGKPAIKISVFSGSDSVEMLAVRSGRVDGMVMDQMEADYEAGTTEGGKVFASVLSAVDPASLVPYVGIGVSKSDPQLAKALDTELATLMADGRYKAILGKYSVDGGAIPKAIINGSTISSTSAGS